MDNAMDSLRNQYAGQVAHIVGKGPSLKYLRAAHFGVGPVITMNEAIIAVQDLGLINPLYSMQKDGLPAMMVRPHEDVTLIVQCNLSEGWFIEHPKRLVIDPVKEWGFVLTEMSIRMCVALAKFMGCQSITFISCDSLSTGDMRTYDVLSGESSFNGMSGYYEHVVPQVLKDVANIPHHFSVPSEVQ